MHYHLKNLEVLVSLGVYESEKSDLQTVIINVHFDAEGQAAAKSDDLADAVDYAEVETFIRDFPGDTHYQLLERLHAELSARLQSAFPQLKNVQLSIEKFPFENGSMVVS